MAVNTPILGLKKPVPNVEENWAFRINEDMDILDQALLVGNVSSKDNVTTFNSGTGLLLISGSINPVFDHIEAVTLNSDFITVSTGTFIEVNVGSTSILGTEIITASGTFGDELTVSGSPVTIGLGDPLTVTSGTFEEGLSIPQGAAGTKDGQIWIDPTTSGLRWKFDSVVFEVQGTEV